MQKTKPASYAVAIRRGFRVCAEDSKGDLNRRGTLELERIDRATGDREVLIVPFTAQLQVKPPSKYRIERAVYEPAQEKARAL